MAAGSVEQLAAHGAWAMEWDFDWNIKEQAISNVWRLLKWIFYAPGDLLLPLLMKFGVALSNESEWSALLSACIWAIVLIVLKKMMKFGT